MPAPGGAALTGMLAVVAMGIQNALSRTALADLGPTTIMTGNTTQIVIDLVDLSSAGPEQAGAIHVRLRKMLPAVAGFAAGAVLGALAFAAVSFWCVLLPAAAAGGAMPPAVAGQAGCWRENLRGGAFNHDAILAP
ncbi:DUF1275 family protein [Cupriavidus basilensis]